MELLLAILAFGTMGAVLIFAYRSEQKTLERLHKSTQSSSLAADGDANRKLEE